MHAYRSRAEVARYLHHGPLELRQTRALVADWLNDPARVHVVIEHEGAVVGDAGLSLRASSAKPPAATRAVEARLGYVLHPAAQGHGLATEAVGALVRHGLDGGLRRLGASVFAPATASSRLLARLGFHHDGTERAAVLGPDGTHWWDDQSWSLLAD